MAKRNGSTRASSSSSPSGVTPPASYRATNYTFQGQPVFRNEDNLYVTASGQFVFRSDLEKAAPTQTDREIKIIDKTGFKTSGGGNWELDTPYGGAQILDETRSDGETFGYKEYGVSVWDADYNMIENGQERGAPRFSSLNEAKRYAKDLLKNKYR